MFEKQRLVTCGVLDRLSPAIQEKIWKELEERKQENPDLDYLQVFRIAGLEVWVIDDGMATTMLFPEEY